MNWIICPSCDEEFRIINDSTAVPEVCPYCADPLPLEDPEDEDYDE